MMRNTKGFALLALGGKRILGVSVVALLSCSLLSSCIRISTSKTTTTTSQKKSYKTESYYKTEADSSVTLVVVKTDDSGNKTTKTVTINVFIDGVRRQEFKSKDEVEAYLKKLGGEYKIQSEEKCTETNGDSTVNIKVEASTIVTDKDKKRND